MRPTPTSPLSPDLEQLRAWLEDMIATMRFVELVIAVISLIARMRDINLELIKRINQLTLKRPRSETLRRLERQLALPLGELSRPKKKPAPATDSTGDKPNRRGGGRGQFPAHLQRIADANLVPPELRVCPLCGSEMRTMAHSTCETLDIIPARIVVHQRIDETVSCPNDNTIVSAPPPPAIVERGKLGDGLIVEATCDKFLEHLPVERQCRRFARCGVDVAPQTLGRNINAHIDLLQPVAKLIAEQCRGAGHLGTDATSIPVLDPDSPEGIRMGTIWCWTNTRWVTFFYAPRGDAQSVRDFLGEDVCRTVQCDGTSVTNFIERAGGKRPGCMSHARRRFVVAARGGDQIALEGLRLIAPLFKIERVSTLAGDAAEQRLARRREHSAPLVDKLRAWLDEQRGCIPPKTPLGRALGYLYRQWKRLTLFLEDGHIELTNNRRERELRRLVLGRKNWLFTWMDSGGERIARILTIIGTCIAHDVNPRAYLHLVTRLIVTGWPQSRLRELLPDRILVPHPELYVGESSGVLEPLPSPALLG